MKAHRDLLIIIVVAVAAIFGVGKCYSSRADEWEDRAVRVTQLSKDLRARAEVAESEAADLRSQAEGHAEEAEAREPVIRERIDELPPAETPGEVERDEIIVELEENRDEWKLSYELEKQANGRLQVANTYLLARGDSLQVVLDGRPGKKPWFIPELGVGPFVGICAGGSPCAGPVALTLTWKISP